MAYLVLVEQENDEKEAVEEVDGAGERGLSEGILVISVAATTGEIIGGSCEITSLSWTWRHSSSLNFFLGLHLLMQEPIFELDSLCLWD